jgi:hypothetical protein
VTASGTAATWRPVDAPEVVIVSGMHRSGTSFAARAIELLGISLGRPDGLLAPGSDNPAGYWENRAIQELDDELLAHLGGSWDHPPVLDPGWHERDDLAPFVTRAAAILERDFATEAAAGPVGFKDPRLSLLVPFWRRVVPIRTTIVLVRDPRDVAASLAARNTMGVPEASVLWLRYLLAAAQDDPGHLLLTHGAFFTDLDVTLDRIADHLGRPRPDDAARAAVRDHLDPTLDHHRASGTARTSDENPLVALALDVWNDGEPDVAAIDATVAAGLARGWIRAPADSEALASARAEAVSFKEQLKRRNEIVKALKAGRTPPPPLPPTPEIDAGLDRDERAAVPGSGGAA